MGITRAGRKEGSQAGRGEVEAGRSEFGGIKKMGKMTGVGSEFPREAPAHNLRSEVFFEMYS